MIKYNEEIFEGEGPETFASIVWWLVSRLGGKIIVPTDALTWDQLVPPDHSLIMYKEDGKLIIEAERLDQS
jgi:hypothetical protein